jgi:hypothetical protein
VRYVVRMDSVYDGRNYFDRFEMGRIRRRMEENG